MARRRVRFQTSVAETDQSEAMRIFLMFGMRLTTVIN